MSAPSVAIIILNWNGWQHTVECLESIFQNKYPNCQVVVVDNGSTDGSLDKIKEWARGEMKVKSKYFQYNFSNKPISYAEHKSGDTKPSNTALELIASGENLGFARGNNVGMRYALAHNEFRYIMVINNDIVVEPNFLSILLEAMEGNPKMGMVGPKILDYYTGGYWQLPIERELNLLNYLLYATPLRYFFTKRLGRKYALDETASPRKVYVVGGCCMLFKREALEKSGLFDETTFLGWEEYIIAEKLKRAGFDAGFVPASIIYHKIGEGTGQIGAVEKAIIFSRSERYFQDKYLRMNFLGKFIIRTFRFLIYSIAALRDRSYRKNLGRLAKIIFGKG